LELKMELAYVTVVAIAGFIALWHNNHRMARIAREILASERRLQAGVSVEPKPQAQRPPTPEEILAVNTARMIEADRKAESFDRQ